jgi:hypothetical protein
MPWKKSKLFSNALGKEVKCQKRSFAKLAMFYISGISFLGELPDRPYLDGDQEDRDEINKWRKKISSNLSSRIPRIRRVESFRYYDAPSLSENSCSDFGSTYSTSESGSASDTGSSSSPDSITQPHLDTMPAAPF